MAEAGTVQPLLTLAIPTYNRAADLATALGVLEPQLRGRDEVDLFISDNCSPDGTQTVVEDFQARGMRIRYVRRPENIGSDRNFVECFEAARGRYFWLCGDDDIILPGTLDQVLRLLAGEPELDLVYLSSYGFVEDWQRERQRDRLGRGLQRFTDARRFAQVVNIMFTFMSAIIVNRERLLTLEHEPPRALLSTNLTQLGWALPLLRHHRHSAVLWNRPLAARQGNAGGYALGRVFGPGLVRTVERLLPGRPELVAPILNFTVRRWLPSVVYAMRAAGNAKLGLETAAADLREAYGGNWRFWVFAWPVLRLPLPLARLWMKAGAAISMGIYVLTVPGFWRRESR